MENILRRMIGSKAERVAKKGRGFFAAISGESAWETQKPKRA